MKNIVFCALICALMIGIASPAVAFKATGEEYVTVSSDCNKAKSAAATDASNEKMQAAVDRLKRQMQGLKASNDKLVLQTDANTLAITDLANQMVGMKEALDANTAAVTENTKSTNYIGAEVHNLEIEEGESNKALESLKKYKWYILGGFLIIAILSLLVLVGVGVLLFKGPRNGNGAATSARAESSAERHEAGTERPSTP